jgi:hypothetical protein
MMSALRARPDGIAVVGIQGFDLNFKAVLKRSPHLRTLAAIVDAIGASLRDRLAATGDRGVRACGSGPTCRQIPGSGDKRWLRPVPAFGKKNRPRKVISGQWRLGHQPAPRRFMSTRPRRVGIGRAP